MKNYETTITGVRCVLDGHTVYLVTRKCCGYKSSIIDTEIHDIGLHTEGKTMKKISQASDSQKPEPAARDEEGRDTKAALSDDDLKQVSAAGVPSVPTVTPEVLLGRHARPVDPKENNL